MTALLPGRIALVTGGAGRIGSAIAEAFLREGAAVVLADRDAARVAALEETLDGRYPGKVAATAGDQSDPAAAAGYVTAATDRLGVPDILVNAHGIFPNCPVLDVTVEEWDEVFAVNVRGTMLTCQAVARLWLERAMKGAIVNISSAAAKSARAGGAHYTGTKAAVNMLTHVLAIELGPHGIRVNAIAPGLILDEVMTGESEDAHPYVNMTLRGTPLGRTGSPWDVAEAAVFLASDRSAWTTGAILEVTGGTHCGRTQMPLTRQLR